MTSATNWLASQRSASNVNLFCPKLTFSNNHQPHVHLHPCHHPHHHHPHAVDGPFTPPLSWAAISLHLLTVQIFPSPPLPSQSLTLLLFHCKVEAITGELSFVPATLLLMHLGHLLHFLTSYQLRPAPPFVHHPAAVPCHVFINCPLSSRSFL